MSKNISNTCCKLIGLSCLQDKTRERVWQEWNDRFHEHEAFWVDVCPGQSAADIARTVTQSIAAQGIMSLAGQTLVTAIFLDLTQETNAELVREIISVPAMLRNVLGCSVPMTMEFGYLDQMAFADKVQLRAGAKDIVKINGENTQDRKQLCLIATSPLVQEDDNSWKAAILLLDILRRVPDPANFVPIGGGGNPNDDIGFIRYGEFNEKKLNALTSEKSRLNTALGSDGEQELKRVIEDAMSRIGKDIEDNYVVDGNCHPIHPDMNVQGFFAKKAAAKGKDAKFSAARHATWSALEVTAKNLRETIMEAYRPQINGAAGTLDQFIEEAKVGIDLEADTNMMINILQPERFAVSEPQMPGLAYSETGYAAEIGAYLMNVRRYAAESVKRAFGEALLNAYKQKEPSLFTEKRGVLMKQLGNINIRLSGVMTKEDFISMVAADLPLRQTSFFPVIGGGTGITCVLCRSKQDKEELDAACPAVTYFIDEKFGGLKVLDEAPINALQLLLFDCDDQRLEDLIK